MYELVAEFVATSKKWWQMTQKIGLAGEADMWRTRNAYG
jgi:hypothetical protein